MSGVQHVTDGCVSSNVPLAPNDAVPFPVAAATMATMAAMIATMIARIFHQGSENGRSPCVPAYDGSGAHASVIPVGTHGPPSGGHSHLPSRPREPQVGRWTIASFSESLAGFSFFETELPDGAANDYRRWAWESAALDLALRQARTSLAEVTRRERQPVRYVVSTRVEKVPRVLELYPGMHFKLDPGPEWDDATSVLSQQCLQQTRSGTLVLCRSGHPSGKMVSAPYGRQPSKVR